MPASRDRGIRIRGFMPLSIDLSINHQWGLSSVGRAPALQAGGQGFEPPSLHSALVAQRKERRGPNADVGGSNPSGGASHTKVANILNAAVVKW